MKTSGGIDTAQANYRKERMVHWDGVACRTDRRTGLGGHYHKRVADVYQFLIPKGQRVIEIGCGRGDLLAGLKPSRGVGVDFSAEMVKRARERHPEIDFIQADAHDDLNLDERFDYVILSDLLNDLWDVQTVLLAVRKLSYSHTRIIINSYSRLWELPLTIVRKMGLAQQMLYQNWLTVDDIAGLLTLADLEPIRCWEEILCPLPIPLLNRFVVKLWPFKYFALTHFVVAKPSGHPREPSAEPSVSIIIPARNEAGNIPAIFARVPEMGRSTELIFVEGHSTDGTREAIAKAITADPRRRGRLFPQAGTGKGDAVRLGFSQACGDILMIFDADMTVPPEDLPRFFDALRSGKAEFVNGVRLVYPMERQAMRFANLIGNKFFSLSFTWLLGQPIKDTLCGTKALWRSDYERIASNRAYFGDFDPFGDFDLLFGATKLNLKIREVPIRYRERTYGSTNIRRWRHGLLLLKMVLFAIRRIKFI
jgi:ubiquinone/menaquinone biosynthesis C-methylase UbiE